MPQGVLVSVYTLLNRGSPVPLTKLQPLFIEVHRQRTNAAVSVLPDDEKLFLWPRSAIVSYREEWQQDNVAVVLDVAAFFQVEHRGLRVHSAIRPAKLGKHHHANALAFGQFA